MSNDTVNNSSTEDEGMSYFERYLSVWVGACILAGLALGQFVPEIPNTLEQFSFYQVNLPVAVLIWLMIYPMMAEVDFKSVVNVGNQPKGLVVTLVANWLIKPFTMFFFAWLFLRYIFSPYIDAEIAQGYLAGAIILGAAPCTAMVFVWSYLTEGDAGYTLVQVSINDLILLVAYAPLVAFLLGIGGIEVPWMTVFLSVILFIVIPLFFGYLSRVILINKMGEEWFENSFLPALNDLTMIGLLLTLILLFSFQGEFIMESPLHILLIAIPLTIQTIFIFALAYGWSYVWNVRHSVAAPASMIGASNFFELAVATSITLWGMGSPAALATVVGVLIEVPLMLSLCWFANKTRDYFQPRAVDPT